MVSVIRVSIVLLSLAFICCGSESDDPVKIDEPIEAPLEVGYSLAVGSFTPEELKAARAAGIKHIEVSGISYFVDGNRNFKLSDDAIVAKLTAMKKMADEADMNIWSIHMPFGQYIDISLIDEDQRQSVVAMHKKLVGFLKILEPEIILFHPSWYLELNERDGRKSQMIKSAAELNEAVREAGSTMVLENMLGPALTASNNRERPLMRTVEETVELFQRLPSTVYLAVDMNHIKNPENLIRALGSKLKTVHIADGTGEAENHFFPCSGEGRNNWTEILAALEDVGYEGPFMYESAYPDHKALVDCYQKLYEAYAKQNKR